MWWRRSWFSLKGKAGIRGQRRAALLPRSGSGRYPWDPCTNVTASLSPATPRVLLYSTDRCSAPQDLQRVRTDAISMFAALVRAENIAKSTRSTVHEHAHASFLDRYVAHEARQGAPLPYDPSVHALLPRSL